MLTRLRFGLPIGGRSLFHATLPLFSSPVSAKQDIATIVHFSRVFNENWHISIELNLSVR